MIYKPQGAEISITSANTVGNNMLIRVLNTGATAVLHIANTGGEYANISVSNTHDVIIEKSYNDTLTGANMLAVALAYRS